MDAETRKVDRRIGEIHDDKKLQDTRQDKTRQVLQTGGINE